MKKILFIIVILILGNRIFAQQKMIIVNNMSSPVTVTLSNLTGTITTCPDATGSFNTMGGTITVNGSGGTWNGKINDGSKFIWSPSTPATFASIEFQMSTCGTVYTIGSSTSPCSGTSSITYCSGSGTVNWTIDISGNLNLVFQP